MMSLFLKLIKIWGEEVADELVKILENVLKKRNLTDIPLVVSKSLGQNLEVI